MTDGHRICTAEEHDPANGKSHGLCVRCGIGWPCLAEQQLQRIRDNLEHASNLQEAAANVAYNTAGSR